MFSTCLNHLRSLSYFVLGFDFELISCHQRSCWWFAERLLGAKMKNHHYRAHASLGVQWTKVFSLFQCLCWCCLCSSLALILVNLVWCLRLKWTCNNFRSGIPAICMWTRNLSNCLARYNIYASEHLHGLLETSRFLRFKTCNFNSSVSLWKVFCRYPSYGWKILKDLCVANATPHWTMINVQLVPLRIDILTVPTSFCCAWLKFSLRPKGKDLDPFGSPWYGIKKPMKTKLLVFFKASQEVPLPMGDGWYVRLLFGNSEWLTSHVLWNKCQENSWNVKVEVTCYDAQLEHPMSPGLIAQIPLIPGKSIG